MPIQNFISKTFHLYVSTISKSWRHILCPFQIFRFLTGVWRNLKARQDLALTDILDRPPPNISYSWMTDWQTKLFLSISLGFSNAFTFNVIESKKGHAKVLKIFWQLHTENFCWKFLLTNSDFWNNFHLPFTKKYVFQIIIVQWSSSKYDNKRIFQSSKIVNWIRYQQKKYLNFLPFC